MGPFWHVTLTRQYAAFGRVTLARQYGAVSLVRYIGTPVWGRQFWCVTLARQYGAVSFGALHWHVGIGRSWRVKLTRQRQLARANRGAETRRTLF